VHCARLAGGMPLGASARAFAVEEVHQQVGEVAVGQLLGGDVADERVYLGRRALVLLGEGGLDGLLAGVGDDLGDAFGLCELLRELHHQPRNRDAARGPQELGLVRVLHAHGGGAAHDIFSVGLDVVALEVGQLLLEVAHLVLQVHDVVAGDLAPLGGVVVLAVRVGALAGPAPGQPGVASRLALDGSEQDGGWRMRARCREGKAYRAAATARGEGVGGAVLRGAVLGLRGRGFRLRLRRRRDFHSSLDCHRREAEGVRCL
jgi:hypothetical protein